MGRSALGDRVASRSTVAVPYVEPPSARRLDPMASTSMIVIVPQGILHRYNYHRPHTALKGLPVYRTLTVMNLHGCNT